MSPKEGSFWSGMSGAIAAVTALITAVGALLAVLVQVGVIGGDGDDSKSAAAGSTVASTLAAADWAARANEVCERTNEARDDLPEPGEVGAEGAGKLIRTTVNLNRRMIRGLAGLPRPPDHEAEIGAFVRTGAQMNSAIEETFANLRAGKIAPAQRHAQELSRLGKKFDRQAIDLGATTCAEGASEIAIPGS